MPETAPGQSQRAGRLLRAAIALSLLGLLLPPLIMERPLAGATEGSGSGFVFYADDEDSREIFKVDVSGTQTQLTNSDGSLETSADNSFDPSWKPDGTKIVYSLCEPSMTTFCDLWTMDANGSNKAKLNLNEIPDDTDGENCVPGLYGSDADPSWSPDGNWIVFTSNRGPGCFPDNIHTDLWKVAATGGTPTPLTDDAHEENDPAWSPDGQTIVFNRTSASDFSIETIRVIDDDGQNPATLVGDDDGGPWNPDFNSDGTKLAYEALGTHVANSDGTNPQLVSYFDEFDYEHFPDSNSDGLVWSSTDPSQLAVMSRDYENDGAFTLGVVGVGSHGLWVPIAVVPETAWDPDWHGAIVIPNQAPAAVHDSWEGPPQVKETIPVLANDSDFEGDPITITSNTEALHGHAECTATECTYVPELDFEGFDTFTYDISDGELSDTATVQVDVGPVTNKEANPDTKGIKKTRRAKRKMRRFCRDSDSNCGSVSLGGGNRRLASTDAITPSSTISTYMRFGYQRYCDFNNGGDMGWGVMQGKAKMWEFGYTGVDRMVIDIRAQVHGQNFFGQSKWVTEKDITGDSGPMYYLDRYNSWMPTDLLTMRKSLYGGYEYRLQIRWRWFNYRALYPDELKAIVGWKTVCYGVSNGGV
jgi:Bacterial Ig domain/WD40-like Beta Propeller Repeat